MKHDSSNMAPLLTSAGAHEISGLAVAKWLIRASAMGGSFLQARLPMEVEWEYACRAGTTTDYYGGDGEAALDVAGWFGGEFRNSPHPVKEKEPNAFGLYDMHGNVWEWCSDVYEDDAFRIRGARVESPHGAEAHIDLPRVIRGGCWGDSADFCRSAVRDGNDPFFRVRHVGFRLCVSSGSGEPSNRRASKAE